MHTTATLDFAQEELAGKLLHMIVTQLEGQLEPWSKVSEEKQQIALNAMSIAVEGAVREAVYVIASDRRTTLRAVVESVTFKDGIKAVLSLSKGDGGRHELADAEGGTALVIVGELDKYATGTEKVGAAPEQPGLPLSTKTADPAPVSGRDLPDRPATPQVQEAPPIPEVLKLKDGSFQVVIGKDKLHYPGSPESFKSAARAESWLTKHLDEKDSGMLAEAGYSAKSRHVDNTLAALRSNGYVVGGRDGIEITDAGMNALGAYDPLPTGTDLRDYWMRELDKAASVFLGVVCDVYPNSITRDELAVKANYSPSSRHVDNTLAQLRSRELVSGGRDAIRASESLFE
jgi:hypothetical protein